MDLQDAQAALTEAEVCHSPPSLPSPLVLTSVPDKLNLTQEVSSVNVTTSAALKNEKIRVENSNLEAGYRWHIYRGDGSLAYGLADWSKYH